MTPEDLLRVQTQAEAVLADDTFAETFYTALFDRHPELATMFPADLGAQRVRFGNELSALLTALGDLPAFEARGRGLGRRHREYGVRAEHFPLVRDALIDALATHVGDGFSADDDAAWRRAYNLVTELMQEGSRGRSDAD